MIEALQRPILVFSDGPGGKLEGRRVARGHDQTVHLEQVECDRRRIREHIGVVVELAGCDGADERPVPEELHRGVALDVLEVEEPPPLVREESPRFRTLGREVSLLRHQRGIETHISTEAGLPEGGDERGRIEEGCRIDVGRRVGRQDARVPDTEIRGVRRSLPHEGVHAELDRQERGDHNRERRPLRRRDQQRQASAARDQWQKQVRGTDPGGERDDGEHRNPGKEQDRTTADRVRFQPCLHAEPR
jgi:hypothetical protein